MKKIAQMNATEGITPHDFQGIHKKNYDPNCTSYPNTVSNKGVNTVLSLVIIV